MLTTASPIHANMAVSALAMVIATHVRALRDTQALTAKQVNAILKGRPTILFCVTHTIVYCIELHSGVS